MLVSSPISKSPSFHYVDKASASLVFEGQYLPEFVDHLVYVQVKNAVQNSF